MFQNRLVTFTFPHSSAALGPCLNLNLSVDAAKSGQELAKNIATKSYILKAVVAEVQTPQKIWYFSQKERLRTQKLSMLRYVNKIKVRRHLRRPKCHFTLRHTQPSFYSKYTHFLIRFVI